MTKTSKNLITVKMNFGYKGEEFVFQSVEELPLHLDSLLEFAESIPRRIARANDVDTYSYMFDALECTPVEVIKAEGYVSRFMHGESVPLEQFIADCNNVTIEMLIRNIAETYLPEQAESNAMYQALMAAYAIGYSAGGSH
ncbi:hypothetical protein [Thiomicrorhabdus arctica]|uniref:hypothetical protein n=1 Tax=Thiomicrorhabdus arctica TaxID=131540 RepID=UPI00037BC41E|nr:hypothetical protein [Thiomicrorhabdus arctica]